MDKPITILDVAMTVNDQLAAEQEKVRELREALAGLVAYIDSDAISDYPPSVWGAYPPPVMVPARAILEKTK